MPVAEARRQAALKFGAAQAIRERHHDEQSIPFIENLLFDLRYAVRMLGRFPGFAFVSIATIALGIGATTAIYSVIDATLLHPLPYPNPAELVRIQDDLSGVGAHNIGISVRVLPASELALSLVLMVAASLLLRSFWDLFKVQPGFNPDRVMAIHTWLPGPNDPATDIYRTATQESVLLREILRRRLQGVPGTLARPPDSGHPLSGETCRAPGYSSPCRFPAPVQT
jgi:hypothetical protein